MNKRRRRSNQPYRTRKTFFERFSLFLTLIIVSAFAIFAGYVVGQWASTDDPSTFTVVDRTENNSTSVVSELPSEDLVMGSGRTDVMGSGSSVPQSTVPGETRGPVGSTEPPGAASSPAVVSTPPAATPTVSPPPAETPPRERVTPVEQAPPENTAPQVSATPTVAPSTPVFYRVRVGAFQTRDEAEREANAVKAGDPPIPDAFVTYDSGHGVFRVQVGSFRSLEGANELAEQMNRQGFEAIVAQ